MIKPTKWIRISSRIFFKLYFCKSMKIVFVLFIITSLQHVCFIYTGRLQLRKLNLVRWMLFSRRRRFLRVVLFSSYRIFLFVFNCFSLVVSLLLLFHKAISSTSIILDSVAYIRHLGLYDIYATMLSFAILCSIFSNSESAGS